MKITTWLLCTGAAVGEAVRMPLRSVDSLPSRPSSSYEHVSHSIDSEQYAFRFSDRPTDRRKPPSADIHPGYLGQVQLVDILVGIPTQYLTALVDINQHDAIIVSSDCDTLHCSRFSEHPRNYTANASSTYVGLGPDASTGYQGWQVGGNASADVLRVAGLEVEEQAFVLANREFVLNEFGAFGDWDAVVGLRLDDEKDEYSVLKRPNLLHNLMDTGKLERNLFAYRPATSNEDLGEITFGQVDPRYEERLKEIPLLKQPRHPESQDTPWTVAARSVSFGNVTYEFREGSQAFFETMVNWIGVPYAIYKEIERMSPQEPGAEPGWLWFPSVSCEARETLPDLVVKLGPNATPFHLPATKYIYEAPYREIGGPPICYIPVIPDPETTPPEDIPDWLRLGTGWLGGFYSVFDVDRRSISLAPVD